MQYRFDEVMIGQYSKFKIIALDDGRATVDESWMVRGELTVAKYDQYIDEKKAKVINVIRTKGKIS